jgi:hypothetical protein
MIPPPERPEMSNQEAIQKLQNIRDGYKRQIREGSADGYWDHLQAYIEPLDRAIDALSVVSAVPQEKKDQEDHARSDHPRVIRESDQRGVDRG